jgi:hypothetical protein
MPRQEQDDEFLILYFIVLEIARKPYNSWTTSRSFVILFSKHYGFIHRFVVFQGIGYLSIFNPLHMIRQVDIAMFVHGDRSNR